MNRSNSLIGRRPFKDEHDQWWIIRNDDDRTTQTALGPFLTPEHAVESERIAREREAPLPSPLSHRRHGPPQMSGVDMRRSDQAVRRDSYNVTRANTWNPMEAIRG